MTLRVLAAIMLAAAPVAAQGVRGTIAEQASKRPIAGAVVLLLDATNAPVARDLSSESGSFRLSAPQPGVYRVRTLRIGFRPVVSEPITLASGPDKTLELFIENIPVNLTAVTVTSRANCPARQGVTQAHNAWNEVATALNAALLSSRVRGTSATVVGYDRWTAPGSDVVLRQGANVRVGLPGQPWRSVSADSLHRAGFVVREANGWYTFHSLDLDVLLSDVFLQDHCLQLGNVSNGEIALEFTPSRDRDRIAEIRGFVWIDATTLELRRLQYRYVNVLRQYEEADAGGDLEFRKLSNGSWIISKWQIRMPTGFVQQRSDSYGGLRGTPEIRATEVKITGGDVLRVVHNGDTLWAVPARPFEGKVLDSLTSRPVAGARVILSGTAYSTVTNEFGRFRMADVLPGAYSVHVHTPELDSLVTFHEASVILVDHLKNLDVRVPNRDQAIAQLCPAMRRGERTASGPAGLLYGVFLTHDGVPVTGTEVLAEWSEAQVSALGVSTTANSAKASTDARGVYRLCGVPTDHRLMLSTASDGSAFPTPVRIESDSRVRRYDITLDAQGRRITGASAAPAPPAQPLAPVEVSAERVAIGDFEERRALGIGHFITRAELDKQENRQTGDVLSKVPGARVARALSGGSAWLVTGRVPVSPQMASGDSFDQQKGARPACYADVWIDNARVYTYRRGETLFDVNTVQPNQIEAIEVYVSNATIPARYVRGGSEQCGVLIIWTKR